MRTMVTRKLRAMRQHRHHVHSEKAMGEFLDFVGKDTPSPLDEHQIALALALTQGVEVTDEDPIPEDMGF